MTEHPRLEADTQSTYRAWRQAHDDGYAYDEICDWVDGHVSRGELLRLMDAAAGYAQEGTQKAPG